MRSRKVRRFVGAAGVMRQTGSPACSTTNSSPRYRIRFKRSEKVLTASVADTCVVIESDCHTECARGRRGGVLTDESRQAYYRVI